MELIVHLFVYYRFMGYSKRSVKNKARVEGSICSSYLHRETTHFCSHYFNNKTLSPVNGRNATDSVIRHPHALSVFCLSGHHAGRDFPIFWPSDKVFNAAHVHVLINCTEVKPYIEYVSNFSSY